MSANPWSVGDGIEALPGQWTFGGEVCESFDVHVRRSVPLYEPTQDLIVELSKEFVQPRSRMYDLGCSTGTLVRRLASLHRDSDVDISGLDVEEAMIEFARKQAASFPSVSFVCADIRETVLLECDWVTSCYTLQFVARDDRQRLLDRIAAALRPRGAFVLVEKVRRQDPVQDRRERSLYEAFKRQSGYTHSEIEAKKQSLRGVMEPMSEDENLVMLKKAGFRRVETFVQFLCFQGWICTL